VIGDRTLEILASVLTGVLVVLIQNGCQKILSPGCGQPDFKTITAVDAYGNISSVDPNDWCPPNTFVGNQLYVHPIEFRFGCDSVGSTVNDTLNIFNFRATSVEITEIIADNPVTTDLDSNVISANSGLQMSVEFTLPDSNAYEGNIYIQNSSSDGRITVSVKGKGIWGGGWEPEHVYSLGPAYPNPTQSVIRIPFSVAEETEVDMRIINIYSETVRILCKKVIPAGTYSLLWDLGDDYGQPVNSGLYRCICEAGGFSCRGDIQVQ